jgi:hypothetical protein
MELRTSLEKIVMQAEMGSRHKEDGYIALAGLHALHLAYKTEDLIDLELLGIQR